MRGDDERVVVTTEVESADIQNGSGQPVGPPVGATILRSRAMSKSQTVITASLDFQGPGEEGEGGIGCLFMPDFEDGPMRLVTISPQGPAGREDLQVGDVLLEVTLLLHNSEVSFAEFHR